MEKLCGFFPSTTVKPAHQEFVGFKLFCIRCFNLKMIMDFNSLIGLYIFESASNRNRFQGYADMLNEYANHVKLYGFKDGQPMFEMTHDGNHVKRLFLDECEHFHFKIINKV